MEGSYSTILYTAIQTSVSESKVRFEYINKSVEVMKSCISISNMTKVRQEVSVNPKHGNYSIKKP